MHFWNKCSSKRQQIKEKEREKKEKCQKWGIKTELRKWFLCRLEMSRRGAYKWYAHVLYTYACAYVCAYMRLYCGMCMQCVWHCPIGIYQTYEHDHIRSFAVQYNNRLEWSTFSSPGMAMNTHIHIHCWSCCSDGFFEEPLNNTFINQNRKCILPLNWNWNDFRGCVCVCLCMGPLDFFFTITLCYWLSLTFTQHPLFLLFFLLKHKNSATNQIIIIHWQSIDTLQRWSSAHKITSHITDDYWSYSDVSIVVQWFFSIEKRYIYIYVCISWH